MLILLKLPVEKEHFPAAIMHAICTCRNYLKQTNFARTNQGVKQTENTSVVYFSAFQRNAMELPRRGTFESFAELAWTKALDPNCTVFAF